MTRKMKASLLQEPGVLTTEIIDTPEIIKDEVLIKVSYAGICGSDLPRSQAENGARMYPLVLGHEFSGVVESVGEEVKDIKVGDRVAVAPLIPHPDSPFTKEGLYGLSDNYNIIGTGSNGAFAEFVKAPEKHVIKLPDDIDLETAAGIEPASIAYHAFDISGIKVGDTVAVLGAGSIGQFAIQVAKVFGAKKVIAVDIFDDKLELAKELGADIVINSKTENLLERIGEVTEDGLGVNLVIETAGSSITQEQSLLITRKNGTVVFVGISHKPLNLSEEAVENILRGELTIKGSWNSYTAPYPGRAWTGTIDAMQKGQIVFSPMISHRIQLEDLNEYLAGMFDHSIQYNKVVIEVNPSSQKDVK
ncbi:galactitol-1-phosphate 5-dehydrogenase [Aerococcaceae bacterium WGS1372]